MRMDEARAITVAHGAHDTPSLIGSPTAGPASNSRDILRDVPMAINPSLQLVVSAAPPSPAVIARGLGAAPADAPWVEILRRAAIVGFPAVTIFCILVPWLAGRIFWTIAIASLPLFFVIAGYHRWRRICPLSFVAQLSTNFGKGGRRRAGRWLHAHFYHVSFGMLFVSLWLRLVATNGDGYA